MAFAGKASRRPFRGWTTKKARDAQIKKVANRAKKTANKNMPPQKLKKFLEAYLKGVAIKYGGNGIAQVIAQWGAQELSVKLGEAYAGAIEAPKHEIFGSVDTVPLLTSETMRRLTGQQGLYSSKKHVVRLKTGQPPTRANMMMSKLYGINNLCHFDTIRDNTISDSERQSLTVTAGFNQKTQFMFASNLTGYNLSEFDGIFGVSDDNPLVTRQQTAYANIQYMRTIMKITNINKFLPIKLKIHLITYQQQDISYDSFLPSCCNIDLVNQLTLGMPVNNQLTVASASTYKDQVSVDPLSNGILSSAEWKGQMEILHTISQKIPAGDILEFDWKHFCGPGVRLDKLYGEVKNSSTNAIGPIAYGFLFEMVGVPVEGYRADDATIRYLGTGPGALSFEFRRTMLGSNIPLFTTSDAASAYGGKTSSVYGMRVFTKDITRHHTVASATRIKNFSPADIVSTAGTSSQIVIPIMSQALSEDVGVKT